MHRVSDHSLPRCKHNFIIKDTGSRVGKKGDDSQEESKSDDWEQASQNTRVNPGKNLCPQRDIDRIWENFLPQKIEYPHTILPEFPDTRDPALHAARNAYQKKPFFDTLEKAIEYCRRQVQSIAQQCRDNNQHFVDEWFDLEGGRNDCLNGLVDNLAYGPEGKPKPMAVKRVREAFDAPNFLIDGWQPENIVQGCLGDCWFIAALSILCRRSGHLARICAERDEETGVYGFVFWRDGSWIHEIVDDRLYLHNEDLSDGDEADHWARCNKDSHQAYRLGMQTGSGSLYFASCRNRNETWVPLLEKAFAKAHGDYASLETGTLEEALEALTGGVTRTFVNSSIIDKDRFWQDLLNDCPNQSCQSPDVTYGASTQEKYKRKGIDECHAFAILAAAELPHRTKLIKLRDPNGYCGWDGSWANGKSEWTADTMKALNHTFDDPGTFWMPFDDFLLYFQETTRLQLTPSHTWSHSQRWTSVVTSWRQGPASTSYRFKLLNRSRTILVCQPVNDRFFRGLTGEYCYAMRFSILKKGEDPTLMRHSIGRAGGASTMDVELDPGEYTVFVHAYTDRTESKPVVAEVVKKNLVSRAYKLYSIGRSHEAAHARGELKVTIDDWNERLRNKNRKARQEKARRAFEAGRLAEGKAKLARMRRQARKTPLDIKLEGSILSVGETSIVVSEDSLSRFHAVQSQTLSMESLSLEAYGTATAGSTSIIPACETPSASSEHNNDNSCAGEQKASTMVGNRRPYLDRTAIALLRSLRPADIYDPELDWCSDIDGHEDGDVDEDSSDEDSWFGKSTPMLNDEDKALVQNPWNAIATFGMRIYTKAIDVDGDTKYLGSRIQRKVKIEVVRDGDEKARLRDLDAWEVQDWEEPLPLPSTDAWEAQKWEDHFPVPPTDAEEVQEWEGPSPVLPKDDEW